MLDSSHLVGRNLTANLEMLRRYQAGLKFKATATVLIAAKRFKKKLSKAKKRRAHRPAPIEEGIEAAAAGTQNDKVHKLGPTLSSSKLLTPVLTQNRQDMKKQKSRPRRDKGFDRKNSTEKSAQLTVSGRSKGPRSRICEYDDNGRQVGAEKNGSEIDILTGTQLLPVERKHVSRSDSWQRSHRASGEICTSSSNSPYIGMLLILFDCSSEYSINLRAQESNRNELYGWKRKDIYTKSCSHISQEERGYHSAENIWAHCITRLYSNF